MKLGVFTALFGQQSLDESLDYIKKVGLEVVELGTGNYPGNFQEEVRRQRYGNIRLELSWQSPASPGGHG